MKRLRDLLAGHSTAMKVANLSYVGCGELCRRVGFAFGTASKPAHNSIPSILRIASFVNVAPVVTQGVITSVKPMRFRKASMPKPKRYAVSPFCTSRAGHFRPSSPRDYAIPVRRSEGPNQARFVGVGRFMFFGCSFQEVKSGFFDMLRAGHRSSSKGMVFYSLQPFTRLRASLLYAYGTP